MRTSRLRVTLREAVPTVVRVVDVPADATLAELHSVLQVALGWADSHLHRFEADGAAYGIPDPDDPTPVADETDVQLRGLPSKFAYHYDFGDGWEHDVEVLGAGDPEPGVRYGENPCPPEDCGGPGGYAHLQAVLADPGHPEYEDTLLWTGGGLADFDQAAADRLVRDTVGVVPESVRLVLELLAAGPGGGVKLTPGGRLPRSFVREVQEHRPGWCPWGKPASVEEDLPPLFILRDLLREAGLARQAKGVLYATRAAGGPGLDAVRRLRRLFLPGHFDTALAETAVPVLAARGPMPVAELAEQVHPLLGWGWTRGGRPMVVADVLEALRTSNDWVALDLVAVSGRGVWSAGPSATSLLPTATMRAHLLDR